MSSLLSFYSHSYRLGSALYGFLLTPVLVAKEIFPKLVSDWVTHYSLVSKAYQVLWDGLPASLSSLMSRLNSIFLYYDPTVLYKLLMFPEHSILALG